MPLVIRDDDDLWAQPFEQLGTAAALAPMVGRDEYVGAKEIAEELIGTPGVGVGGPGGNATAEAVQVILRMRQAEPAPPVGPPSLTEELAAKQTRPPPRAQPMPLAMVLLPRWPQAAQAARQPVEAVKAAVRSRKQR